MKQNNLANAKAIAVKSLSVDMKVNKKRM